MATPVSRAHKAVPGFVVGIRRENCAKDPARRQADCPYNGKKTRTTCLPADPDGSPQFMLCLYAMSYFRWRRRVKASQQNRDTTK